MNSKIILLGSFLFLTNCLKAQQGALLWAKSFGNANGTELARSVCIDSKKNVLVTGKFKGTLDFNLGTDTTHLISTGSYSAFIVKLDSSGHLLWAKSFGGTSTIDPITIVADDSDNVITSGTFFQTVDFDPSDSIFNLASVGGNGGIQNTPAPSIFIQKLNSFGNFIWAKRIGANNANNAGTGDANELTLDNDNNIYLAGSITIGSLDFNPNPDTINNGSTSGNGFVLKLDKGGIFSWVKRFGNCTSGGAASVHFGSGYLYTIGANYRCVGNGPQITIRKMNLAGDTVWQKVITSGTTADGIAITSDSENNAIFLYDVGGGIHLRKVDVSGNMIWEKDLQTSPNSLAVDIDNNIYIVGSFSGTLDFDNAEPVTNLTTSGNAAFIQKLDANGYFLWAGQFANSGSETAYKVVADELRNIYLSGYYKGTQDFDPSDSVSNFQSVANSQDAFVAKLKDSHAYITVANGSWNVGSTWLGGSVPPANAAVIIRHNVDVVNANASCYSIIVEKTKPTPNVVTIREGLNLTVTH